eukprot:m51a1_g9584 hypothetical protein (207) ;mRNA; r:991585-993876
MTLVQMGRLVRLHTESQAVHHVSVREHEARMGNTLSKLDGWNKGTRKGLQAQQEQQQEQEHQVLQLLALVPRASPPPPLKMHRITPCPCDRGVHYHVNVMRAWGRPVAPAEYAGIWCGIDETRQRHRRWAYSVAIEAAVPPWEHLSLVVSADEEHWGICGLAAVTPCSWDSRDPTFEWLWTIHHDPVTMASGAPCSHVCSACQRSP